MKIHPRSIIATVLVATMLVSCTTPNGQGSFSQNNPCQPGGSQFTQSPWASFAKQAILNPLASIGGTVLATAAANYSQLYTGKLNTLLTKLVTPKKKKKKNQSVPGYDPGYQQGQPDYNTGYPQTIDPNTGLPVQIDPNTGLPVQTDPYAQQGYSQDPYAQVDPNTGLPVQIDPNTGLPVQTDPYAQQGYSQDPYAQIEPNTGLPVQIDPNTGLPLDPQQGGLQPRGVPGQLPHAIFSPTPCQQQGNPQAYPTGYPQNQPYGYDPNVAQQGQPYPTYANDPNYQGQGYDPYAQQQGQNPYGQQTDPSAQQGYSQDPYAQQTYPSDPYAQQGYPQQDPYAQHTYPSDPYAQQGYPQDPNASGYSQQDPYAQQTYPQDSTTPAETTTGIQTHESGTPVGMDVVLVKKTIRNGASVVLPVKDGDILRDGRGDAKAGDKFRIMFRPNTDGYVYVVAIDGSGWAQGIFPPATAPLSNPVKAGEQYVLPEANNWFSLDQFKGIETIFFVMSKEQRQDIEEILQSITGRERPATESPQQVTKVAMVPYGVGRARPSTKPFSLSGGSGQEQTVIPTSYLAQQAGQDLRLTRWFRHE